MSRRDGPLGGLGVRAPPVRVTSVDESAMQAKLRELKVVMARERTARSEVSHQMEANGGRIWSSSRPSTLRTRDTGGLKLRELTSGELERIQRAKDRAVVSDRGAAIAAVTAGNARSRSGRRLAPLDAARVVGSVNANASASRCLPGSSSSSRPHTPKVTHVVVRATCSVYAPPTRKGHGGQQTDHHPVPSDWSHENKMPNPGKDIVAAKAPRPPAAPAGARPVSGRALRIQKDAKAPGSIETCNWNPDANDMIEPMGDFAAGEKDQQVSVSNRGDAQVLVFDRQPPTLTSRNSYSNTTTTSGGVTIVNETPSLLDGTLDELANRNEFARALREWRGDGDGDRHGGADAAAHENETENDAPSLLDGAFDEQANRREFAEALREWRGDSSGNTRAGSSRDSENKRSNSRAGGPGASENRAGAPAMETQTETLVAKKTTELAVSQKTDGASYFERLRTKNVERMAGKYAADAMVSRTTRREQR
jgi:hypothetical protein